MNMEPNSSVERMATLQRHLAVSSLRDNSAEGDWLLMLGFHLRIDGFGVDRT